MAFLLLLFSRLNFSAEKRNVEKKGISCFAHIGTIRKKGPCLFSGIIFLFCLLGNKGKGENKKGRGENKPALFLTSRILFSANRHHNQKQVCSFLETKKGGRVRSQTWGQVIVPFPLEDLAISLFCPLSRSGLSLTVPSSSFPVTDRGLCFKSRGGKGGRRKQTSWYRIHQEESVIHQCFC